MEYTKNQIKYNWKKDIEDFTYKLQYPFGENNKSDLAKSLSSIPEESSDKKIRSQAIARLLTTTPLLARSMMIINTHMKRDILKLLSL